MKRRARDKAQTAAGLEVRSNSLGGELTRLNGYRADHRLLRTGSANSTGRAFGDDPGREFSSPGSLQALIRGQIQRKASHDIVMAGACWLVIVRVHALPQHMWQLRINLARLP
jgi:hypothetical protein